MKNFKELFPFEYKGGGYFRKKGVAVGATAEILHGEEAIKYLYDKILESLDEAIKREDLLNEVRDTLEWLIEVRLANWTDMQYGKADVVDLLDILDEDETKTKGKD